MEANFLMEPYGSLSDLVISGVWELSVVAVLYGLLFLLANVTQRLSFYKGFLLSVCCFCPFFLHALFFRFLDGIFDFFFHGTAPGCSAALRQNSGNYANGHRLSAAFFPDPDPCPEFCQRAPRSGSPFPAPLSRCDLLWKNKIPQDERFFPALLHGVHLSFPGDLSVQPDLHPGL